MPVKPDLPDIYLVKWADAYEIGCDEVSTLDELEALETHCTFVSIGFLPLPQSGKVILVSDIEIDKKGRVTGYRGGTVIPRQCVLSMEKIESAKEFFDS